MFYSNIQRAQVVATASAIADSNKLEDQNFQKSPKVELEFSIHKQLLTASIYIVFMAIYMMLLLGIMSNLEMI